ncbi:MAG: hypothetical protein OXD43_09470 [Bacteroidetes bacterium]|nr:hypothetical protein [Bacteroidota bacterium]
MDVHKKTIVLCVYNGFTGELLDERELLHDLPKVTKYSGRFRTAMAGYALAMKRLRVDLVYNAPWKHKGFRAKWLRPHLLPAVQERVSKRIGGMRES